MINGPVQSTDTHLFRYDEYCDINEHTKTAGNLASELWVSVGRKCKNDITRRRLVTAVINPASSDNSIIYMWLIKHERRVWVRCESMQQSNSERKIQHWNITDGWSLNWP